MRSLLLSFFISIIFCTVNAQSVNRTIYGKVITADGMPAEGIAISLKGDKQITFTQNDGSFKISALKNTDELIVRSGLSTLTQTIAVTGNGDIELPVITLKEKSYELKEVVVTAQYAPQSLKNSVYNVRSIDQERIKLRGANNIQQVLNTEFGFRFTNDLTLGTTDFELMGMSGRNIKILLDGVPLVDRADARESLNQIDINTVERIEIVEGPVSVVYGTDALAGVINIITKKADKSLVNISARLQEETVGREYKALSGAGNHNKNITASWQNKGFSALAGFSKNDFGGYNQLPLATPFPENYNWWKPKEQYLGNTKLGYANANFSIWYRLDGLKETIDTRYGMNPNNYKEKFQTYTTNRYNNQLQSEWRLSSKLQLNGILGYTDLRRATATVQHNYTTGEKTLTNEAGEQDTAKFNATIFRATAQYTISEKISVQPGFEFNRDAGSGQRIKGTPVINDYAFFLTTEIKPIAQINIRPGVRFIKNTVYDAPKAIPSLNTKFALTNDLDLRLAYARGFRAPALRELYFDFFDASHSIMGNENLKAEHSNSFNGSLLWSAIKKDKLRYNINLAGFYNLFKDRIDYGIDAANPTITTLINISKYKTTGGSITNNFDYGDLQANFAISYIGRYNRLVEENTANEISQFNWTPELMANLTYNFVKLKGSIGFFYKYTGKRPSYQLETATNTAKLVKIGSFSWADLMFNKSIYKYFTLNAGIKNLFDVTQLTNSATASGGAHGTGGGTVPTSYGRSYVLGLTFNWNKN